ncbi:MAG: ABC transporter permease [Chloroflexi bacterium]|uniref:ABC transporter permease n=1 Tax=Candidatus Flexifilum breve TaxID=3140694 RepID=UPI0031352548|nr:ABC transporter permease [Chloroflexota bacterium]
MHRKSLTGQLGLISILLLLIIIFSLLSPNFRTLNNLRSVLSNYSHIAIMAVGVAFPIILGEIDLSVGAIMGLVGMVLFNLLLIHQLPAPLAIGIGLGIGLVNGLLINRFKLQAFIATLATLVAYRGITYGISGRQLFPETTVQAITDPLYLAIDTKIGVLPYAFIYLILLVAVTHVLLHNTKLGMHIYATGGNETAAQLSGINVRRVRLFAYAVSGLCSALAALIMTSRMRSTQESLGLSFELSAITAVIIGGVSLRGGIGTTLGPALGAFLAGTLYTGLTMVGVTTYAQPVIVGIVLLIAVAYDKLLATRQRQRQLERGAQHG